MGVPAAQGGLLQHLRGKNLAKGHHHIGVGPQGTELLLAGRLAPDPLRGEHRDPQFEGTGLHGAGLQLLPPAAAPIGLGHHAH